MKITGGIDSIDPFIGYPTNTLFSIFDNPAAAAVTLRALTAAGFAGETQVYHGESGAHRIDASGAGHGRAAQFRRLHQRTTKERDHAEQYEQAALRGDWVIAVHASDQDRLEQAQQIIQGHGGRFINYYGRFGIRGLVR
jgi:hypothetical protein